MTDALSVPISPESVTSVDAGSRSPLRLEFPLVAFKRAMDVDEGVAAEMKATWSRNVCGVTGRDDAGVVGNSITACAEEDPIVPVSMDAI